jgi:hypothetical protein
MNKKLIIYLTFIGLIFILSNCKKDEAKVELLSNIVAPQLTLPADLILYRAQSSDTLVFAGKPVNPGFHASANYFLEACETGNNFKDSLQLYSGIQDSVIKIPVNVFDAILIKKLPTDVVSSVDFRIRSVLITDAGTGAKSIVSISDTKTSDVRTYGPPTLALTTAGTVQGISSPSDNKVYKGWIYTDGTPFRFTNKDNSKIYGGVGGVLTENGANITLPAGGYNFTVNMTNMSSITFVSEDVTIGIIGDAAGGWASDTHMIYDFTDQTWNLTKNITAGGIKFRTTGVWSSYNVAYRPNAHNLNNLYQSNGKLNGVILESDLGDSQNIDDIDPGNYAIKLYLNTNPWKVVFTPTTK